MTSKKKEQREADDLEAPYCVHCWRMRTLEFALVKLWLEVQQLRGESSS